MQRAEHLGRFGAIHVRRGDYLDPAIVDRFGPVGVDYVVRASARLTSERLVIVSDSPEWCEAHVVPALRAAGGREANVFRGSSDLDDFGVLLSAEQLVLSNSTFSWWAGFAGRAGVVLCPKPWLDDGSSEDLILDGWDTLPKRSASDT
ncbi:alpha-1,2-fucosyltransferase [Demequina capsici]|uniref:alpha-1,2-fucosyltransferase n=1 Tax=Demequina capsici TaxID=3075620 RepID=UPI0034D95FA3